MAFTEKQIRVVFSLANGQFEGGGNSAQIDGLRVSLQAQIAAYPSFGTAHVAIYGLPLSTMQQLSTVGPQWNARYKNEISVLAGDAETGMSLVFTGVIYNGLVDAAQMPDVALRVTAATGAFDAVNPADATSINGSADAAGMIQRLASQMGFSFYNNGVTVKLASPYYYGSAWNQMVEIAEHGNFDIIVDFNTVTVTPRGVPRPGQTTPLISPATGLVSYPSFVENRLILRSLFNPNVIPLGAIEVQSSLTPACGRWQVIMIDHDLDSVTPNGNWFSTYTCVPIGTT